MYTLTGPNEKMRPEKKVELKEEDRRKPELPKPEKLVHVPKLKIRYLGERPSGMNEELQKQLQEGTWGFDEDAVMMGMAIHSQTEEEASMTLLGSNFDTSDLTESEQRQYRKILELREKRGKLQSAKKPREDRESALAKLESQLDSLEQSLYDR
jgi:singapore isolate B (sub-type 7) whole genome shotgun sequence assembly, scaffold_2